MRRGRAVISFVSLFLLLSTGDVRASVASAPDATGDSPDPRADITMIGAAYDQGSVALALKVPAGDPPQKWNRGTFLSWDLKTDTGSRYEVLFDRAGASVYEYDPQKLGKKVCEAKTDYTDGLFTVGFSSDCLGKPRSLSIQGYAKYKDESRGINASDFAPDDPDEWCCQVTEG
jgi:hypothetical protein